MMELKDFIKTIILDIGTAIEEIRLETGDNYVIADNDGGRGAFGGILKFDIAITQSTEGNISGKAGVFALWFGAQMKGDSKELGQNASRIKFDLILHNHLNKEELKSISDPDKYSQARSVDK